jgi:hypothetical protein
VFQVPGELLCLFSGNKPSHFEKNLDLTFKFARSLLYYLDSMLHVDPSTSKITFLPAPAGIAVLNLRMVKEIAAEFSTQYLTTGS